MLLVLLAAGVTIDDAVVVTAVAVAVAVAVAFVVFAAALC